VERVRFSGSPRGGHAAEDCGDAVGRRVHIDERRDQCHPDNHTECSEWMSVALDVEFLS